jgi:hypothetical protein
MRRVVAAFAFAAAINAAASPAVAGETRCWVDNGAVVVSALFGGIAGDFILDLSAPHSQLHLTTAQTSGIDDATEASGTLSVAGERVPARLAIADLDDRGWGFPTGIDGVIGVDGLAGYVVDLRFSPCRLSLRRRAPPATALASLPVTMLEGVPTVAASIFDGHKTRSGRFAIDTGAAGVRISADAARFSRLSARVDPLLRDKPPARLAALSFAGKLFRDPRAGLQIGAPPGLLGGIGTDIWSRYDLRLDLPRRRLTLTAPRARSAKVEPLLRLERAPDPKF